MVGGGEQIREARPKVTLVARMAASVANYDYIVDWEFQADGLIRVKVCLFLELISCLHYLLLSTSKNNLRSGDGFGRELTETQPGSSAGWAAECFASPDDHHELDGIIYNIVHILETFCLMAIRWQPFRIAQHSAVPSLQ